MPYYLTSPFKGTINVLPGQRCILAGDEAGSRGWEIDNFLFIEVQGRSDTRRFIYGQTGGEKIAYHGVPVQKIGANTFNFATGEEDLAKDFPEGDVIPGDHFSTGLRRNRFSQGYLSDCGVGAKPSEVILTENCWLQSGDDIMDHPDPRERKCYCSLWEKSPGGVFLFDPRGAVGCYVWLGFVILLILGVVVFLKMK